MRNLKSLFYFSIVIFFFQGCTRYVTIQGGMFGETNYYFSARFENNLIEAKNDSISEVTYVSEYFGDNWGYYATICEFCNNSFEAEIIFKNLNQKEFSYPMVCSDFEFFTRKTAQIEPGNYEVFMNLNCSGEMDKQTRELNMGEFEIKKGERRNLNILIELDAVSHDIIRPPIKISTKDKKIKKENKKEID